MQPAPRPSIRVSGAHTAGVPTDATNLALPGRVRGAGRTLRSICARAFPWAPVSVAARPTRPRCSPRSAATTSNAFAARCSAPTCRSALSSTGAMRVRGVGDELEPDAGTAAHRRDRDAAVRMFDRRRCTARGTTSADRWAKPSRSTASRPCATTSSRPRTMSSRASPSSSAAVEDAAGAPGDPRGQRFVVRGRVPARTFGRRGANAGRRRGGRSGGRRAHRRARRAGTSLRISTVGFACRRGG